MRFIGGAKGDIRISQLNTSTANYYHIKQKRGANKHATIQNKKPRCCRTHIYTRYLSRSNIHRKPNKGLRNETMRSIICFEFRTLLLFALGHITFWVCVSIRGWRKTQKGRTRATFSKMFHRLSCDLSVERKAIFVSVN